MEEKQVNLLYDYSKFHIGLYAALIVALVTLSGLGAAAGVAPKTTKWLYWTVGFFLLAGAAGGTIASTISRNFSRVVRDERIGPMGLRLFPAPIWASIEHISFWLGVTSTLVGIFLNRSVALPK